MGNEKWHKGNNGIVFLPPIITCGLSGEEWMSLFGARAKDDAKAVLLSPGFVPTSGTATGGLVIIPGSNFAGKNLEDIYANTGKYSINDGLFVKNPHPEIACIFREEHSSNDLKKMGFREVVVLHKAVAKNQFGNQMFLYVYEDSISARSGHLPEKTFGLLFEVNIPRFNES